MSASLARRYARIGFASLAAGVLAACSTLLAPSGATIQLTATSSSIAANSATTLVATVLDQAGRSVQDGTRVSFGTTLGNVSPPQARTRSGTASTSFTCNQIGTATIVATSGSAVSNSVVITVGNAVTVTLSASTTNPTINTAVTFTATVNPSSTAIDHYAWTFGDSTATTTTATGTAQHTYTTTGTMTGTVQAVTSGTFGPTAQIQIVVQ